ncbi:glycoside hydrolase superfamily [Phaeosphaeriaceae sp. PMI808]|nr:glycoside hydrolase superfamily [Phaeosphaeriaceae sp. PMI808]
MKLAVFLPFVAVVAALPAVKNVVPRASFPKADGTKFNIDGVTKYYAGTNSYWIPFLTNDSDVNTIMSHVEASGQRILRVWGFNDVTSKPSPGTVYFQLFSGTSATVNTGPDGLQRLDAVVKAAEKHNVKLIINFVNNWGDFGGMQAYFSACGVKDNAAWYQADRCQAIYQNYVKEVVGRYRDSNAIFAWELANEPRCRFCNTNILTNWIRKSSDYIRSLDANRMIAIGDEGFGMGGSLLYPYTHLEGIEWESNLALPNISFGTFHMYPAQWVVFNSFGDGWIKAHAKICQKLNKPCMLEEYGVTNKGDHCPVESGWQKTSLSLKDTGMASDLFWQLGDTVPSTGLLTHDDGHTIYYGSSDWTCLVDNHIKRIG